MKKDIFISRYYFQITAMPSYQDITIYKNRKIFINNKIQKS